MNLGKFFECLNDFEKHQIKNIAIQWDLDRIKTSNNNYNDNIKYLKKYFDNKASEKLIRILSGYFKHLEVNLNQAYPDAILIELLSLTQGEGVKRVRNYGDVLNKELINLLNEKK